MVRKERRTFGHLMSWAHEFLSDDERKENIKVLSIILPRMTTVSQIVYDETEDFLGPAMPSLEIFVEVLGRYFKGIVKAKTKSVLSCQAVH